MDARQLDNAAKFSMNNAGKSFEDTAAVQARTARRGTRAAVLAVLSRIAEPLVLFPLGVVLPVPA